MKNLYILYFLYFIILGISDGAFPNFYPKLNVGPTDGDPGEPLFLTPYIEENRTEEGRDAAKVDFSGFFNVSSYSGLLTVNKEQDSNMFFWFFPAEEDYENAPVLLWLQGGPGSSSLFGLFIENGPFEFVSETELKLRTYRWSRQHSVIYFDNPVGTGFSFTEDGYAEGETQIGAELENALQQFFTLFPELRNNDFFLTGESYAGKYIPAAAHSILKKNPEETFKINLQGLVIGNGLCDPLNMIDYSDYLIKLGLIDSTTSAVMKTYETEMMEYINREEYDAAAFLMDQLIARQLSNTTVFSNATGFDNFYNFLYTQDTTDAANGYLEKFLQKADVRAAIHVGNLSFASDNVEEKLISDIMHSVAPWVSELLSNYRILFHNGQLDIIVAYPLTVNFLTNLEFSSAEEYKSAARYQWYVDNELAGYVKSAGNLTEVLVRFAGHMVPTDQPKWALDLVSKFVRRQPLH